MGGLLHKLFYNNNGPKDRQLFWRLGHFPPAPTVSVWPCPLPPVTLCLTWSGETKCTSTVWGTPSWLPYSTSLYLDFHLLLFVVHVFHDKAKRTQQGNLLRYTSPMATSTVLYLTYLPYKIQKCNSYLVTQLSTLTSIITPNPMLYIVTSCTTGPANIFSKLYLTHIVPPILAHIHFVNVLFWFGFSHILSMYLPPVFYLNINFTSQILHQSSTRSLVNISLTSTLSWLFPIKGKCQKAKWASYC